MKSCPAGKSGQLQLAVRDHQVGLPGILDVVAGHQGHPGKGGPEPADGLHHDAPVGVDADHQLALVLLLPGGLFGPLQQIQGLPYLGIKGPAPVIEGDPVGGAGKERRPQLPFQTLDALGDVGRRHGKMLCGLGKTLGFGGVGAAVIKSALGNELGVEFKMTADELYTALSLVFAGTDIGSVPAIHDCVTVGSASTLRVDHIKAMLVLGLCEGEFPRNVRDEGLLTEQDKETLAELGVELTDRAQRLTSDELLFVWRAFSKPTESLILSCSTSTPDGQSRAPSAAFSRVKYLFPDLKVESFSVWQQERRSDGRTF